MTAPRRVGFAGPIEAEASLHALWIGRAVEIAAQRLARLHGDRIELVRENDGASAQGGDRSARRLVAAGVDAVGGYFSSAAAAAAIPRLQAARIPLVLAGATVEDLTRGPDIYRVCDSEAAYADWIAAVVRDRGLAPVRIAGQHSAFGARLTRALRERLGSVQRSTERMLCLGQAEFVRALLRRWPRDCARPRLLLVTDDCQHVASARAIADAAGGDTELLVAGYRQTSAPAAGWALAAAGERWPEPPGAFFLETIAAIEVASRLALGEALAAPVETVLGPLAFDERGEARPNRFCLYRLERGQLRAA